MSRNWQELYEIGKRAFDENNFEEAKESLSELLKEKGNFADVYNMMGFIFHDNGRTDEAIEMFKKALVINPAYTDAALNLAVAYNEKGDYEMAWHVYTSAKEKVKEGDHAPYLDPYVKGKLANMHAEIATIYKDLGLYIDAAEEYKKALKLRPQYVDIKTDLGIAYRGMRDYSKAISELEETIKLNPGCSPARVQLGLTYYLMDKKEQAKAQWLKVLHDNPNDKKVHVYLNLLKKEAG